VNPSMDSGQALEPWSPPADDSLNFVRHVGDRISAQGMALAGGAGFIAAWLLAQGFTVTEGGQLPLLFVLCTAAPMAFLSVSWNQTHRRPSSGLCSEPCVTNARRCAVKFVGLVGTLLVLAACYWLLPEYAQAFYRPVWETAKWVAFPILALSLPYILWVDRRMLEPKDGYWHTGQLFLGRWLWAKPPWEGWRGIDFFQIKEHVLGWMVKGFFLPLMLAGSVEYLNVLVKEGIRLATFGELYVTALNLILAVDVLFGSVGYLLTLRPLDSHIRTTEPTVLGWAAAICCYIPFSTFIWSSVLNYKGRTDWMDWLQPWPILFVSWGFAILALHAVYVWSTASFGCRFSNLTNRGIIVDGPYRYLKHPAYVSKNIAWWLMAVPFVAHASWSAALRACVCLALTNLIYILRAWTEERHLMRDPAYVVYCQWMKAHGLKQAILDRITSFRRRIRRSGL